MDASRTKLFTTTQTTTSTTKVYTTRSKTKLLISSTNIVFEQVDSISSTYKPSIPLIYTTQSTTPTTSKTSIISSTHIKNTTISGVLFTTLQFLSNFSSFISIPFKISVPFTSNNFSFPITSSRIKPSIPLIYTTQSTTPTTSKTSIISSTHIKTTTISSVSFTTLQFLSNFSSIIAIPFKISLPFTTSNFSYPITSSRIKLLSTLSIPLSRENKVLSNFLLTKTLTATTSFYINKNFVNGSLNFMSSEEPSIESNFNGRIKNFLNDTLITSSGIVNKRNVYLIYIFLLVL